MYIYLWSYSWYQKFNTDNDMTFHQKCFITQLPVLYMKEAFLVQINFSSCHFFNKFKDVWMASKGPARLRSKVLILYYAIMNLSRWFHFDSTQGLRENGVYKVERWIIRKICYFKITLVNEDFGVNDKKTKVKRLHLICTLNGDLKPKRRNLFKVWVFVDF